MSSLRLGITMVQAIAALKLKGAYRTMTSADCDGVDIIRPAYPTITITAASAEEYARRFEGEI